MTDKTAKSVDDLKVIAGKFNGRAVAERIDEESGAWQSIVLRIPKKNYSEFIKQCSVLFPDQSIPEDLPVTFHNQIRIVVQIKILAE